MTFNRIRISKLCIEGPGKEKTVITFFKGLNVVSGASDTGKSFITSAIDFMLGSSDPLPDIPERIGYERVYMEIQDSHHSYVLERSIEGSDFNLYYGLLENLKANGNPEVLSASPRSSASLSSFLLSRVGLQDKKLKKNQKGETAALTIRNLSKLLIVNEEQIIKRESPIETGQYTEKTLCYSIFKLLLTGIDDSSIINIVQQADDIKKIETNISTLKLLINEYQKEVINTYSSLSKMKEQLSEIEQDIENTKKDLAESDNIIEGLQSSKRGEKSKRLKLIERSKEIDALLDRFDLLEKFYKSDLDRLEAIKESGSLFKPIEPITCPLCGAIPDHQEHANSCAHDVDTVVNAASAEIDKIKLLRKELNDTKNSLMTEASEHQKTIEEIRKQEISIQTQIDKLLSYSVHSNRAKYEKLIYEQTKIREQINVFKKIETYSNRIEQLEAEKISFNEKEEVQTDLSRIILDGFSQVVKEFLKAWNFPDADRINFDDKNKVRDIDINGKARGSYGKGLRAITYSAVIIALMEYCRRNDKLHPGFVVLDSPLVTYKEPEDELDNKIKLSPLKELFYLHLASLPDDLQIIVIENEHPPVDLQSKINFINFTKSHFSGRYGLFPT